MPTSRTRFLSLMAVLGMSSIGVARAYASWPSDPTVNLPLCTAVNNQNAPAIASDGAGGAIVTWEDLRGTDYDIYSQRVSAAGTPLWTADGVALCSAAGDQTLPAIVSDGAGGAIVAWQDGGRGDIFVQRVNAAGVPQWTADGVALSSGAAVAPAIASDGAGGAIVTWVVAGATYDVRAQRVDATGVAQWTAGGVVLRTDATSAAGATIVSDGAGGAIVSWYDDRNYGTTVNDIFAQRVDGSGTPQWTANGLAVCTATGTQAFPVITTDGAGGAIIAWYDARGGGNYIYAQRVSTLGVLQWTGSGVPVCTASGNHIYPSLFPQIAPDGAGGAIVTWNDYRNLAATSIDIYAQRLDATGVPQWTTDGVALCAAASAQQAPTMVSDGAGGAIVTWYDNRNYAADNSDIYAQRVSAAGVSQWAVNGVALSTAPGAQLSPILVASGTGGAIVAWLDSRNGSAYDIYAQNLNADGTLGGPLESVAPPAAAASFALRSIEPNPSPGDAHVSFSLPDDLPARLVVYDVAGRLVESQALGNLGPGAHSVQLGAQSSSLRPGVYRVGLVQGSRQAFRNAVIFR